MQLINKNIENKNIISNEEIDLKKYMTSIKQNCYRLLRLVNIKCCRRYNYVCFRIYKK